MAHKVEIFGRNMEVTDRIRDYVSGKVAKLDRYLKEIEETRVDLAYAKSARSAADRQVAQITVRGKRVILRTEERADDIFAAFDTALDKMQRQIERYKGKHYRGRGDGRSAAEVVEPLPAEDEDEDETIVVRRKRFALYPMNEAEAIEQMKLLGHNSFFIFYNADANAVNVLYRRRDGTYGLIDPYIG
ncbi:MAG: ribosome-associated translation inhibitor RaiA [Chloroflexi bacterium]|nr:ribosome-associated translation inhibitor RaiA [Chloroflexota bacterium]